MSCPIIVLDRVSFRYDYSPPVLEQVSLSIVAGEFVGLVGPNGGGKSTLLKIILGLYTPVSGQVAVFSQSPAEARGRIGYVPQFANFAKTFPISVIDVVVQGRLNPHFPWFGFRRADYVAAHQALEETGIADLYQRQIHQLSGGQLQRVLLARALASHPEILILDEPTSNVDQQAEEAVFTLLRRLNQRMTIVVVSHDIGFISGYVGRVACLNRTLECHDTGQVTGNMLAALYDEPVRVIRHDHHLGPGGEPCNL